jgi:hypothetical protein
MGAWGTEYNVAQHIAKAARWRKLKESRSMTSWIKCTIEDGTEIRLNMDHVAWVRPYRSDRGGKGSEVIFAAGSLSSIVVTESQEELIERHTLQRGLGQF